MLRLQKYDFIMNYIQGSKLIVADALSRAPLMDNTPEILNEEMEIYVHMISSEKPISKRMLDKIVHSTTDDIVLQKLIKYIYEGWPRRNEVDIAGLPQGLERLEFNILFQGFLT